MSESPLRPVRLWQPEIVWDRRADGSVVVRQAAPLGDWPRRMSDRIDHWAAVDPGRVWMTERVGGARVGVTYGELARHIRAIGQALLGLGLSVERPLAILSGNSIGHALVALGAQHVGIPSAAIAPAYAQSSGELGKLAAVRDQITPGAVYVEDTAPFARALAEVFAGLPVLGRGGTGLAMGWDALLATQPGPEAEAAHAATGPDTVAKFLFTSGTTGSPKAVIQTQRMMCANMEQMTDCYAYLRDEPPVILDWAPWNHVAGGNLVFNCAIYNGGTFHLDAGRPTRDGMAETLRNLREIPTNWYWNVPYGFEMLVEAMEGDADLARVFFSKLKFMYYAGAAMARHTWDALDRLAVRTTGERLLLTTGLGATETAPFALFCTDPDGGPGNVGVPARGVELKLVPVDGKWEARIKGPNVTPGYWRNPKLTAEAFDEEGFYRLGDSLRFAEPGNPARGFFFDGRIAENFKMATGTWVAVGPLRARVIDALGGIARDVVITGEGEGELGALIVPFRPEVEKLVPGGAAMADAELFTHTALAARVAERLAAWNRVAGGASLRVPRAMVLAEALSLEAGEVTDKGSVNQRAVRARRAGLVADLHAGRGPVIRAG